jgi:MFS family permease
MNKDIEGQIGYLQLLRRNKSVRRLWFAQVVSELGDWLNFVAQLQIIKQFSGSAQAAGWLIILQLLPLMVFSPIAGMVADRFNRRYVMIAADLLRAVIVLGFLTIDKPEELWLLYVLAALQFSLTAFFEPARSALLPTLAEGDELVTANALTGVTWSVMLAVGGALGGVIAGLVSNTAAFIVDSASFFLSAALLLGFPIPKRDGREETMKARVRPDSSFRPAFAYLRERPQVLALLLVKSGICVTAGGVWLLSVVYGQRVFPIGDGGALSVGIFYGAHGFGAIIGANFTGRFFRKAASEPIHAILWGFLIRSGFFLLWGLATNITMASLAMIGVAACGSLLWVLSTTMLQQFTPDEIRGRIFAIEFALLTLTMSASIGVIGHALDYWGISPSLTTLSTAVMAILIALCWLMVLLRWRRWAHS